MSFDVPEPGLRPDQMVARAVGLRSRLRDDQAHTEANSRYSKDMHDAFVEAGFYRILQPRMFGGYEFDIQTFYRTIIEIARGCPSTGWMLCLGAGHALQLGSSFSQEAQAEIAGPDGHFVAPLSVGNFPGTRPAHPVDGGYRVSGATHRAFRTPPISWAWPTSKGLTPPRPCWWLSPATATRCPTTGATSSA